MDATTTSPRPVAVATHTKVSGAISRCSSRTRAGPDGSQAAATQISVSSRGDDVGGRAVSGVRSAVPMDPVLARDYPRQIRETYVAALRKANASERHHQLLRLGEVSLAHLASLAFADYRQARTESPDPAVEGLLSSLNRVTLGEYLQLFRLSQKATGRPEIFGIKRYEVNTKLERAADLAAAIQAVDYAKRVGATSVRAAIEQGLPIASK